VDLRQSGQEVLEFGLGEVCGDLFLNMLPFRLDRFPQNPRRAEGICQADRPW
jgi:hypothetical protein